MEYDSLYCKVFLETPKDRAWAVAALARFLRGEVQGCTVVSDLLELDLLRNEDFDPHRQAGDDGFLYFRYYLDVVPSQSMLGSRRSDYVTTIASILNLLTCEGCQVVAACDFEEELHALRKVPTR